MVYVGKLQKPHGEVALKCPVTLCDYSPLSDFYRHSSKRGAHLILRLTETLSQYNWNDSFCT